MIREFLIIEFVQTVPDRVRSHRVSKKLPRQPIVVVRPAPETPVPLVPPLVAIGRKERPAETLGKQLQAPVEPCVMLVPINEDVDGH